MSAADLPSSFKVRVCIQCYTGMRSRVARQYVNTGLCPGSQGCADLSKHRNDESGNGVSFPECIHPPYRRIRRGACRRVSRQEQIGKAAPQGSAARRHPLASSGRLAPRMTQAGEVRAPPPRGNSRVARVLVQEARVCAGGQQLLGRALGAKEGGVVQGRGALGEPERSADHPFEAKS